MSNYELANTVQAFALALTGILGCYALYKFSKINRLGLFFLVLTIVLEIVVVLATRDAFLDRIGISPGFVCVLILLWLLMLFPAGAVVILIRYCVIRRTTGLSSFTSYLQKFASSAENELVLALTCIGLFFCILFSITAIETIRLHITDTSTGSKP